MPPANKRVFLRQEDRVGRGLSPQAEVRVGCKRCGWMDRQTRCQGNKEERFGQRRRLHSLAHQSFSYIPCPV